MAPSSNRSSSTRLLAALTGLLLSASLAVSATVLAVTSGGNDVADIVQDQHYWAREMLLRVQDPRLGPVVVPGVVPKLAASPGGQQWLGPRLGEHTDSVLRDVLGVATEEIAELRGKGLV